MIQLDEQFTKNQLQDIFDDVFAEFCDCEAFSGVFDPYYVYGIELMDKRNKRALGRCRSRGVSFYIQLSPWMLDFESDKDKIIRAVCAHEILHTFEGCFNHGPEFHKWAKVIYDELGYVIDTHADTDASAYFRMIKKPKYKIVCDNCGTETFNDRMSDAVVNPAKYMCKKCQGQSLTSYIRNDKTDEYEVFRTSNDEVKSNIQILCPDCEWTMGFNRMTDNTKTYLSWCLHGGQCPKCGATTYAWDNRRNRRIRFKDIGVEDYSEYRF